MTNATQVRHVDFARATNSEAAVLGAAIGDALGWPHEMRPRRVGSGQPSRLEFKDWTKRSGGRFQPTEERIDAGSYSDDTQLILAVARCLGTDPKRWCERFAYQELPFWTLYERGGGGATKRSATSWMNGTAPWKAKPDDVRRYFEAGGNGVAMRILPHCIALADRDSFEPVAENVMADGVCTHGHPRALVGALAYAFAVWTALRHRGTLAFGRLIAEALSSVQIWGRLPSINRYWSDWWDAADALNYRRLWDETVQEQVQLFQLGMQAIEAGAASFDEECLEKLGCFDKRVNGSGTVTAAGALYLGSRHAADPAEALRVSALAHGADSDTLASMTCGLLGAVVGGTWLENYLGLLQDRDTLLDATRQLLGSRRQPPDAPPEPFSRSDMAAFKEQLGARTGGRIQLPIGIDADVEPWNGFKAKGPSTTARAWVAKSTTGQTFFLKVLSRGTKGSPLLFDMPASGVEANVGVRLAVRDLRKSRRFYEDGLGLSVSKETDRVISFGRALAISAENPDTVSPGSILVYIEVSDLATRLERLAAGHTEQRGGVSTRAGRSHYRCVDPDGYQLEIYEKFG